MSVISSSPTVDADTPGDPQRDKGLLLVSLTTLGVVFGDIGTSPLYAFRESFGHAYGIALNEANVLGVLSLIFWSLILVISVKYLGFILRADNRGEGGVIALTALVAPARERTGRYRSKLAIAGLFGAALLYGDGMITPAISVLSAVEGLEVATPVFKPFIIPITIVILVGLFSVQRHGTAGIGRVFGPITLIWFLTLAALGIYHIADDLSVMRALSPHYGALFFINNGWAGFLVLGSVFLVVTGGEALYADLGHFGAASIRRAWFWAVLPALVLNYFGQGALLLSDPTTVVNPFYRMAPAWALYPVIIIATAATVIASQAVITGAFSLTRQAVQLGFLPRMKIAHTSASTIGQIYVPIINWGLMTAAIGLVIGFGNSSNLAAAYGVAVTTDMVLTTILFAFVARTLWNWSLWTVVLLALGFLVIDLAFWGANMVKVPDGGWFPLLVAAGIFTLMTTWKRGRQVVGEQIQDGILPVDLFLKDIEANPQVRVPGTAIFMVGNPTGTPRALLHNLKHNKILHERVIFFNVTTNEVPVVKAEERLEVVSLGQGFHRIVAYYGFTEAPDIPDLLRQCKGLGLELRIAETSFFLGRDTLIPSRHLKGMAAWREAIFAAMSRNEQRATAFYQIPPNRVVELGAQVEM